MPTSEVVVLNPINPHTLTTRPLILPADKTILIRSEPAGQDVIFSKDGEICDISGVNMMARIRRSDFTIDLIKLPEQTYFDTLRNKLMWGMDIRDNVDF
jgi:NAD+ kinase